jgi:hypothetical protein
MADYGYGNRANGTPKGRGYFGELKTSDGRVMTELGSNATIDGEDLHYPLIHPGMSRADMDHLTSGGNPTSEMHNSAIRHALQRKDAGKDPFAGEDDEILPIPMTDKEEYSKAWKED